MRGAHGKWRVLCCVVSRLTWRVLCGGDGTGDMAFYPDSFDLKGFVRFFESQKGGSYYDTSLCFSLVVWFVSGRGEMRALV